jgi:hypothetical protein
MGALSLFDKLGRTDSPLLERFKSQGEFNRAKHFQKLYDYYMGDKDEILMYLVRAMGNQFKPDTLRRMQIPYIDIVRKVIDRSSLAYKDPAERWVEDDAVNITYQELLEGSNINVQAKRWNRLAKLLDTVYVAPVWRNDHIEYDLFPPHLISVRESPKNYLEPLEILYEIDRDGSTVKVFWSATEHYILDQNDRKMKSEENPNGVNPYGLLQFIPCRLRETEDHWGEGDSQLVDVAEKTNILLCSTFHNAIMQSHGQAVGINLNKKGEMQTGPDTIIEVDGVREGMVVPNLFYAQPTPAIQACLLQIDWMIRMSAVMRGLTADSVSIDTKAQSASAKYIDNVELMELRQDDIEALRKFEKKLFIATAAVWNYHTKPQIPLDSKFICDFSDILPMQTEVERMDVLERKYKLGLWTPVDELIDEDEGVDEEKAIETVKKNLELRKTFSEIIAPQFQNPVDPGTGVAPVEAKGIPSQ